MMEPTKRPIWVGGVSYGILLLVALIQILVLLGAVEQSKAVVAGSVLGLCAAIALP
jgi:hypothetical protein